VKSLAKVVSQNFFNSRETFVRTFENHHKIHRYLIFHGYTQPNEADTQFSVVCGPDSLCGGINSSFPNQADTKSDINPDNYQLS
jgi:hypothetical protein